MNIYRTLVVVLVVGFINSAVLGGTGYKKSGFQGQAVAAVPFTTPDSPDMPADELPGRSIAGISVPDTPDMPSDDPDGGGNGHFLTTPDSPEMPSDEPDRQQGANKAGLAPFPSATSLWDRTLAWFHALLDIH